MSEERAPCGRRSLPIPHYTCPRTKHECIDDPLNARGHPRVSRPSPPNNINRQSGHARQQVDWDIEFGGRRERRRKSRVRVTGRMASCREHVFLPRGPPVHILPTSNSPLQGDRGKVRGRRGACLPGRPPQRSRRGCLWSLDLHGRRLDDCLTGLLLAGLPTFQAAPKVRLP